MSTVLALPARAQPTSVLEPRIIGALLMLGASKAMLVASGLEEGDFSDPRCRLAWRIMRAHTERGRPVTAETVFATGRTARAFAEEDLAWLEGLQFGNTVSAEALADVMAELRRGVKASQMAAVLGALAGELRNGTFDPARMHAELGRVQALLSEPGGNEVATADLLELLDRWERNEKAQRSDLVSTGLRALDDIIGGYPPSSCVIYGAPGAGKTGVIASGIRGQLLADPKLEVGIFGLEDGTRWFSRRVFALQTGMLLREVGWKPRTPEQVEEHQAVAAEIQATLTDRIHVFRTGSITSRELVRRAYGMARAYPNLRCIYVDNNSQVKLSGESREMHERMEEYQEALREFAEKTGVPTVQISHINQADVPFDAPPPPSSVRGGRNIDQKARLMLAVWNKGEEWRVTVTKANESPGKNTTLALKRHEHAGLVDCDAGEKVNLQEERRLANEARAKAKMAEADKRRAEREAAKAAKKAEAEAAKPPPPAQPGLFGGAA